MPWSCLFWGVSIWSLILKAPLTSVHSAQVHSLFAISPLKAFPYPSEWTKSYCNSLFIALVSLTDVSQFLIINVCALYFSVFGLFHHYRLNYKGHLQSIAWYYTYCVVKYSGDTQQMSTTCVQHTRHAQTWAIRHKELHCYAPITKYFILMPMKSNHIVSNHLPMKPVFYILILSSVSFWKPWLFWLINFMHLLWHWSHEQREGVLANEAREWTYLIIEITPDDKMRSEI